jgi:hypothetical protein
MKILNRPIFYAALLFVLGTYSCSGDEEKEPVEAVEAAEPAAPEAAAAPEPEEPTVAETPAPAPVAVAAPAVSKPGFNPGNHLFVKSAHVSIRSEPGKKGKAVAKLDYGTKALVIAKEGNWIKIKENEWVSAASLTTQYQYVNKDH